MGFLTGPRVPAPESSHRAWIGQRFSYQIASLLPPDKRYATSVDRPIAQVTSGLSRGVSPWRTRDTKTASARDQPPSSRRNEGATANHFIRGRRWRRPRPGRPPGRPRRARRRRWSCGRSRPGRHTAIPRWPRSRILNAAASVSRSARIRETSHSQIPNMAIKSSTLRVDTPCTQVCVTTTRNLTSGRITSASTAPNTRWATTVRPRDVRSNHRQIAEWRREEPNSRSPNQGKEMDCG
jgi:hypothetical protein